jgi:hypothetical protein
LLDTVSNEVVSTATTDAAGNYSFTVDDGLRLGRYQVRVVLANGQRATTPASTIALTRGDTAEQANLGVADTAKRPPRSRGGTHMHRTTAHLSVRASGRLAASARRHVGM